MKAVALYKSEDDTKPGSGCNHPVKVINVPTPSPGPGQVLVKVIAASYNRRDLWSRQGQYAGVIYSTPEKVSIVGSDAVGVVASPNHPLSDKIVLVNPSINWVSDAAGPDCKGPFGILGNTRETEGRGTFTEYIVVGEEMVVECPKHFDGNWALAAAVPLGGVTAWRATFTKAQVKRGHNVLITGIGGGVAVTALQLAVAAGANVYVSSSSEEKIKKAVSLGAKAGVNYKNKTWPKDLAALLPKDRPYLDSVIDSGGGSIMADTSRLLKHGGILSCFGQTTLKPIDFSMVPVLKNIELRGSTMGSLEEFKAMVSFVDKHKIVFEVSTVLDSLDEVERGYDILREGSQFGKIIIKVSDKCKL